MFTTRDAPVASQSMTDPQDLSCGTYFSNWLLESLLTVRNNFMILQENISSGLHSLPKYPCWVR